MSYERTIVAVVYDFLLRSASILAEVTSLVVCMSLSYSLTLLSRNPNNWGKNPRRYVFANAFNCGGYAFLCELLCLVC